MRIGIFLNYAGGFAETVVELADYERAGLDIVFVPEPYSFDAVSQLGFIAAKTERVQIASGILPLYSRTPALLAMTAAGLDYVSGGRFTLGLGASGPPGWTTSRSAGSPWAWARPARRSSRGGTACRTTRRSAGPARSSRSAGWSGAAPGVPTRAGIPTARWRGAPGWASRSS